MNAETPSGTLNVGVVGLGLAGAGILPAIVAMPNVNLIGATDINLGALQNFRERYDAKTYASIEELCDDPAINTVWVATPNLYHCKHAVQAANQGKHVIVEKPMAISLSEAEEMIEAVEKNNVHLICGGSRSSSAVVRKMREIVKAGELGPLKVMSTWAATDWMLRPRRPDEYDESQGGGVVFRQAPHQVDSVRLLAGGLVQTVRGMTGQWMTPRDKAPGYFSALLGFQDGVFATLVYSSHGYFMATELFDPETGGSKEPGLSARVESRAQIVAGTRDEDAAKAERTTISTQSRRPRQGSPLLSDLGLLVVSCEHGEMRQSPQGIFIYGDEGTTELSLAERGRAASPELEELQDAIVHQKPVLHSGRWGLATLEVSLAIMQSAKQGVDIPMQHQVAVPEWA